MNSSEEIETPEKLDRAKKERKLKDICLGGETWTIHHLSVFFLTFLSFALFHVSKKSISYVKSSLQNEWLPQFQNDTMPPAYFDKTAWDKSHHMFTEKSQAVSFFGVVDSVFLAANALGLYIFGAVGDRFEPRLVLATGMWTCAILCFFFGSFSKWFSIYSETYFIILWMLSGLTQSAGWPNVIAIMGCWFGKRSRGLILGFWSSCSSIGNIIGAFIASNVIEYGYEYVFLVNASLLFAGGIVIYFGLVSAPRDVDLPDPEEKSGMPEEERPKAIGFFRAILLPGVIVFCLAFACLKLVHNCFLFWLPYYLKQELKWSESVADDLSTLYDWGGIVGGILGGIISDHLSTRVPVIVTMLLMALVALFGYSRSPTAKFWNILLMIFSGFFILGPCTLISSTVSADLGRQSEIRGNAEALGTVTGLIDGTGSVGAAIGQVMLPKIEIWWGWSAVFYMFIIMTCITLLCILPLLVKDIRTWYRNRNTVNDENTKF